ncbi:ABC transporter ATP-binding protein [Brevibacterium sp. 50QC2O2]|uniref:dipeptide ABC transporter ATP-binding protein n=1 Tax=unclassified Brevibacterium TaxID=2614124 RepID=UPI00211D0AA8|nr:MULTISPECIES: ABC transporter ATP-binding protein [unclassified Brevibacterium]MCQ9369444.1 ABC transporter ATP-binding protein [Brevibacterium sp. 91QC2O2]MCQ9388499.1 ABC transporter ATP-binding protein [Brevibacterium sp. 50QC2O2]
MLLQTKDLSVGFGKADAPITSDVSFSIAPSEIVALVGESGSGKSVTAMEVAGLNPRNSWSTGSILFDGQDLGKLPEAARRNLLRREIGVIFQDPLTSLNPVYTIGTLMHMSMKHRVEGTANQRARALELLEMVNMPDPAGTLKKYPHQLSGGQRQRVMIAMAIAATPKLLIADEPTTALDVTVQADILDLLDGLKDELQMSVLLITHDMGVVANSADRMYVMKGGRIVESGSVDDVFNRPQDAYTRDLFAAVPRMTVGAPEEARAVAGAGSGVDAAAEAAPETAAAPAAALTFSEVDYYYSRALKRAGAKALDQISLTVAPGRTVGLVGESGSGKSTIGKLAVGLLTPGAGTITTGAAKRDRASAGAGSAPGGTAGPGQAFTRSMVFQDPASSLDPRRSIGESIAAPLIWSKTVGRAEALRRAGVLLERVHLPASWAGRYPHELSGGQRQRVGIARGLTNDPDLLVADEPTSALDVSVQAAVLELFQELQHDYGFACLFISHDLAVVEQVAQDVIVLQRGAIQEAGPTTAIVSAPSTDYAARLIASSPVPDPAVQKERKLLRA